MYHAVHGFGGAQAACIVTVGDRCGAVGGCGEASSVLPGEVPAGAVIVADGIAADRGPADGVGVRVVSLPLIGDPQPVVSRQQIPPIVVAVGIGTS